VRNETHCPRPEDLYLYLEGELGPYEARKLEEHVECCAACRDALAERRLLHEAFTSLAPFVVPAGFAKSVMDGLPEPETRLRSWVAPIAAAMAALGVALIGYNLFTGLSVFEILVALNRSFGQAIGQAAPVAAKMFKTGGILLKVAGDLLTMGLAGFTTLTRVLGPQGVIVIIGLAALLAALAVLGARRLQNQGE